MEFSHDRPMPRVPAFGLADGVRAVRREDLRDVLGEAFRAAHGAGCTARGGKPGFCWRASRSIAIRRLGGEHEQNAQFYAFEDSLAIEDAL